jgi:hypothetical protein
MDKIRTHYDNLQISESAGQEVIKGAYKYLSQKWHPDKNPERRDEAERVTKIINEAYAVLSDPARRADHDEWIARQRAEAAQRQQPPAGGAAPDPAGPMPADAQAHRHMVETVAKGRAIPGFLLGLGVAFFGLGVLLQVEVFARFIDRHSWLSLVILLAGGAAWSQYLVEARKRALAQLSMPMLHLAYQERMRTKTVWQVVLGLLIAVALIGGIAFIVQQQRNLPDASVADGVPPVPVPQATAPAPTVRENEGVLNVINECGATIRLLLIFRDDRGAWKTTGRWSLAPSEDTFLRSEGQLVRSGTAIFYIHGETEDGAITWQGTPGNAADVQQAFEGTSYLFKQVELPQQDDGTYPLRLQCTS